MIDGVLELLWKKLLLWSCSENLWKYLEMGNGLVIICQHLYF